MSRLGDLQRLREVLLESIDEAPADKRAPLAAQLRATLAEIESLDEDAKAGDPVDEIAKRRAARRAGTA